jgi:hypothetical protein
MKQLTMTPALSAMIKQAVGADVDTSQLAVFETIALNTNPLPGKRGTLFENAVVEPVTLKQMVEAVNSGGHLPLIADHELFGAPKGRVFHAGLDIGEDGAIEMRALFYLDPSEIDLITKLNSGSLDEVSVAFLSKEFLCSDCGWDYFGAASTPDNIYTRTCANGHKIGLNGVHGEMFGLNQFIEMSLVARGAADKPKIVGKSQAKLAPEGLQLLAATGFQMDELVVQASAASKEVHMDLSALTAQLTATSVENGSLKANLSVAEAARDAATSQVTSLTATVAERDTTIATLTTERDTLAARPEAEVGTERDEAVTFLQEQVNHLLTASGKPKLEGDALPSKVADLKAKISELTGNLTSILPVGGKAVGAGSDESGEVKLSYKPADAFGVRK